MEKRLEMEMLKSSAFYIVFLYLMTGCSMSSIRTGSRAVQGEGSISQPIDFELSIQGIDKSKHDSRDIYMHWFSEGVMWGEDKYHKTSPSFILRDNSSCKVNVFYSYDGNSFTSWKSWVSALSFFIVPVKFKTVFKIAISKGANSNRKTVKVDTWKTILLLPATPFIRSEGDVVRLIAKDLRQDIIRTCYENRRVN
jgi:hypothetical protein